MDPEDFEHAMQIEADLLEEIGRLKEALGWCAGSADFHEGGAAETGWQNICAPLLGDLEESQPEAAEA